MSLSEWKRCLCPLGSHLYHVGYYVLMVGYSGEHKGSGHDQISSLKSVDEAIQV